MSFKLTLGRMGIADVDLFTNEAIAAYYPEADKSLPEWLFYALPAAVERTSFETAVKGATLNKAKLRLLTVSLPGDISEQRRVVEVLATVDEHITHYEALVEKQRTVRTGLVRDLLKRLPTALMHELSSMADVAGGVTLGRKFAGPGTAEFPYLRVANVQDGHLDLSDVKTMRLPTAAAAKSMLQHGDVLMNEGGDFDKLGRGAVWRGEIADCLHQNHVFRVRCSKEQLLPEFLALWAASDFGRRFFLLSSKQSTNLASINSTQLKRFPVLRPSITQQREVLEPVSALDAVIRCDQRLLETFRLLKQGLLQDLVTGTVRVPVARL